MKNFKLKLTAFLSLILVWTVQAAEVRTYPNATPLAGTERILGDQGSTTVNITPAMIAAYLNQPAQCYGDVNCLSTGQRNVVGINGVPIPSTMGVPIDLGVFNTVKYAGTGSFVTAQKIPLSLTVLQQSGVIDITLMMSHFGISGSTPNSGTSIQLTIDGNIISQWFPASTVLGAVFKTQIVISPDVVSGTPSFSNASAQMIVQSQNPTAGSPYGTNTTQNYEFNGITLNQASALIVNLSTGAGDTIQLDGGFVAFHQASGSSFAPVNSVATWGDSLTYGMGAGSPGALVADQSYPGQLYTTSPDIGRTVYNGGISGQTSSQIAARAIQDKVRNDWTSVYWMGRNDAPGGSASFTGSVLPYIQASVANLSHSRFVVMSIMNSASENNSTTTYTGILSTNSALQTAYPNNYLDIRGLMSTSSVGTVPIKYRNITAQTTSTYASGVSTLTVASAAGITNGMFVTDPTGVNITDQTTVTISGTTVTLSSPTIGAGSTGTLNFVSPTELHFNSAGYVLVKAYVSSFLASKGW